MKLSEFLDEEVKQDLREAYQDNKFSFIGDVGFFTWSEIEKNGKLHIYISNMWIDEMQRNKTSLLYLRKFFRDKYPDAEFFYYHREKDKVKNGFHYLK